MNKTATGKYASLASVALLSLAMLVSACNSGGGSGGNVQALENTSGNGTDAGIVATEDVYAYRANSPYAEVLKTCVLINQVADSCLLSTLPPIGDGQNQPTVEQVLERVLVTHNWMGQRFEAFLHQAPSDLLNLFSSTTAILIGSDVRPSFYTTISGAIQLDPRFLWMTIAEKRTISDEADYRSEYGKDLQFRFWLTHAIGTNSATPYYNLADDSNRKFADIVLPLSRLLYHELTHAADFVPRHIIPDLVPELSMFENIDSFSHYWLSPRFFSAYPLENEELFDIAKVRFRNDEATEAQKNTSAALAGEWIGADGAISLYSYLTIREDLANLVEATMMSYHYGVDYNVGTVTKPADPDNAECNDYIVGWGQRNRLGEPAVARRAHAAARIVVFSGFELDVFFQNELRAAEQMRQGEGWCANRYNKPSTAASSRSADSMQNADPQSLESMAAELHLQAERELKHKPH